TGADPLGSDRDYGLLATLAGRRAWVRTTEDAGGSSGGMGGFAQRSGWRAITRAGPAGLRVDPRTRAVAGAQRGPGGAMRRIAEPGTAGADLRPGIAGRRGDRIDARQGE
ncbi:MAG: hypothetical protein ACREDU_13460, partial [Methylocella sp.]